MAGPAQACSKDAPCYVHTHPKLPTSSMNDCTNKERLTCQRNVQHEYLIEVHVLFFMGNKQYDKQHCSRQGVGRQNAYPDSSIHPAGTEPASYQTADSRQENRRVCRWKNPHQITSTNMTTHPKPMPATRMVQKITTLMMKTPFQPPRSLRTSSTQTA